MEIRFKNMLEVCNTISAIEDRIKFDKSHGFDLSMQATLHIYNQFRPSYDGYYPWKYDTKGNEIKNV